MRTRDSFDTPIPRTAARVRMVEIRLLISEDDFDAVPAVPEVVEDLTAIPPIIGVPAVPAVPAHTDTMFNSSYRYEILDADGELLELRGGELDTHASPGQKGQVTSLLNSFMAKAKGSIGP